MNNLAYFKHAIDTLRKMERSDQPAEICNRFDRFIREQIFGSHKLEMTPAEIDELQNYYVETL